MGYLTADELLAGSAVTHAVEIPADLLPPRAGSKIPTWKALSKATRAKLIASTGVPRMKMMLVA